MKIGAFLLSDQQWDYINRRENPDGSSSLRVSDSNEFSSATTPAAVSVLATSTTALAASTSRRFALFVNDSDETIYLTLGATAVLNRGIRLNAGGGNYEINSTNLYTGVVSSICASGSKNLLVTSG